MKVNNGLLREYWELCLEMGLKKKRKEQIEIDLKKKGSMETSDFVVKVGFQSMTCAVSIKDIARILGVSQAMLVQKGILQEIRYKKVSVKAKPRKKEARLTRSR